MSSSRDAVECTVHGGEMLIHLDNVSVKIPPQLLERSEVLTDALSVAEPSVTRKVTLAAPKEWLQAWVACYCNKEEDFSEQDNRDLVHCLLVCFLRPECGIHRDVQIFICRIFVQSLSTATLNTSSHSDLNLILFAFLPESFERGLATRRWHRKPVPMACQLALKKRISSAP
jgi:hypothetical protein